MKLFAKVFFALIVFSTINIYCSKSQESPTAKKANTTLDAASSGGCTCSDNDSSGTYTPAVTSFNVGGVIAAKAIFTKIKNVVTVDGHFLWLNANSIGQGAIVTISLPILPAPVPGAAFGTGVLIEAGGFVNSVFVPTLHSNVAFINQTPGTTMQILFSVQTIQSGGSITYHFVYELPKVQ